MNKYLIKISGLLDAKLGLAPGQKIPQQTLQALSQNKTSNVGREARGALNLKSKGGHNKPLPGTRTSIKLPGIKQP